MYDFITNKDSLGYNLKKTKNSSDAKDVVPVNMLDLADACVRKHTSELMEAGAVIKFDILMAARIKLCEFICRGSIGYHVCFVFCL